jgi:hypothetical protein
MLKEIMDVSFENHTKPLNTRCRQNAELVNGKAFGIGLPLYFKGLKVDVF